VVQKKFILPNLFTGLNFLLGVYAILQMTDAFSTSGGVGLMLGSSKPPLVTAAWIIAWCSLLDKLDGFAARLLNASSEFGAQFDSLADLTAFGIAPGFLVYFTMQSVDTSWFVLHRPLALASASVYMLCAALRLARFNAIDSGELKEYFHGLPSTFAGSFVAMSIVLYAKYDLVRRFPHSISALPLLLILPGLLMVSPLYLPKLLKRRNKAFNAFQILCIFITYLCGFGMIFPEYLYAEGLAYGVIGFAYGYYKKGMIENGQAANGENP
jgi:CDP-diacylglycerol--serine O-phosphatidyltransferase